jgi:hypothetical protein
MQAKKLKAILDSPAAQKILVVVKCEADIAAAVARLHRLVPLPWRWCVSRKTLERYVRRALSAAATAISGTIEVKTQSAKDAPPRQAGAMAPIHQGRPGEVMRKVWAGSTSDRTVWRCASCATINDWSATLCGYCGKSYNGEEKMWECSCCYTVNSWSAAKCGHCDKEYKG